MIKFENLSLKFGDRKILEDFNLHVAEGEKVLLSAPSGSGKSTILKLLLGFVPPDSGKIVVNGFEINKKNISQVRNSISYVSQDVELKREKVSPLLEEIFSYKGNLDKNLDESKLSDLMKVFELDQSVLQKNIKELSGGERQRLGIIICIMLDRSIWLLDEITSALETSLKDKVIDYILDSKKTVLVVSHDMQWEKSGRMRVVML
jgi:putative ABC transport system ATP-binding protein